MTKREYGVFRWTGTGIYRAENADKLYKIRRFAEERADRMNRTWPVDGGWVVRIIYHQ